MQDMSNGIIDYVHEKLNEEIHAIGGHYMFTDEIHFTISDREVLVLLGNAVFDRTCCGYTGFGYAWVAGFIVDWKYKLNELGLSVSRIEPIKDETLQTKIRLMIKQQTSIDQVEFKG